MAIIKRFGVDFFSDPNAKDHGALTLPPCSVFSCSENVTESEIKFDTDLTYSQSHPSGWTISGKLHTDYYVWVNDFEATHPQFGKVWGNFEKEVHADSEEAYAHFYEQHPPNAWDYWDI